MENEPLTWGEILRATMLALGFSIAVGSLIFAIIKDWGGP